MECGKPQHGQAAEMGAVTVDRERQGRIEDTAKVSEDERREVGGAGRDRGSGAGEGMLVLLTRESIMTAITTIF